MHRILIAIVLSCAALPAVAWATEADPLPELCGKVLDLVASGDRQGYELLFSHGLRPSPDEERDRAIQHISRQWETIHEMCGAYLGHEVLQDVSRGESLRRLVLIARHERSVVRCDFTFYRPQKEWKLLNWSFHCNDEATQSLFKDVEPLVARRKAASSKTLVK